MITSTPVLKRVLYARDLSSVSTIFTNYDKIKLKDTIKNNKNGYNDLMKGDVMNLKDKINKTKILHKSNEKQISTSNINRQVHPSKLDVTKKKSNEDSYKPKVNLTINSRNIKISEKMENNPGEIRFINILKKNQGILGFVSKLTNNITNTAKRIIEDTSNNFIGKNINRDPIKFTEKNNLHKSKNITKIGKVDISKVNNIYVPSRDMNNSVPTLNTRDSIPLITPLVYDKHETYFKPMDITENKKYSGENTKYIRRIPIENRLSILITENSHAIDNYGDESILVNNHKLQNYELDRYDKEVLTYNCKKLPPVSSEIKLDTNITQDQQYIKLYPSLSSITKYTNSIDSNSYLKSQITTDFNQNLSIGITDFSLSQDHMLMHSTSIILPLASIRSNSLESLKLVTNITETNIENNINNLTQDDVKSLLETKSITQYILTEKDIIKQNLSDHIYINHESVESYSTIDISVNTSNYSKESNVPKKIFNNELKLTGKKKKPSRIVRDLRRKLYQKMQSGDESCIKCKCCKCCISDEELYSSSIDSSETCSCFSFLGYPETMESIEAKLTARVNYLENILKEKHIEKLKKCSRYEINKYFRKMQKVFS